MPKSCPGSYGNHRAATFLRARGRQILCGASSDDSAFHPVAAVTAAAVVAARRQFIPRRTASFSPLLTRSSSLAEPTGANIYGGTRTTVGPRRCYSRAAGSIGPGDIGQPTWGGACLNWVGAAVGDTACSQPAWRWPATVVATVSLPPNARVAAGGTSGDAQPFPSGLRALRERGRPELGHLLWVLSVGRLGRGRLVGTCQQGRVPSAACVWPSSGAPAHPRRRSE